jgi:hypothetical protein
MLLEDRQQVANALLTAQQPLQLLPHTVEAPAAYTLGNGVAAGTAAAAGAAAPGAAAGGGGGSGGAAGGPLLTLSGPTGAPPPLGGGPWRPGVPPPVPTTPWGLPWGMPRPPMFPWPPSMRPQFAGPVGTAHGPLLPPPQQAGDRPTDMGGPHLGNQG